MEQFNPCSEYLCIIFAKYHFLFSNIFFESETFKDNFSSIDFSNTLLNFFVSQVDSLEFSFSWIFMYVSNHGCNRFQASDFHTWSSCFGIKGFNSFNSVFDFFNWWSLLFFLNRFKYFFFIKWNSHSLTSISFQLNQHLLFSVQEFLFFYFF